MYGGIRSLRSFSLGFSNDSKQKRRGRARSRTSENQDSSNQAIPPQTFVIFNKYIPPCEDTTQIIAGLPRARSVRGTKPHTHRIWSTSFRLVVT